MMLVTQSYGRRTPALLQGMSRLTASGCLHTSLPSRHEVEALWVHSQWLLLQGSSWLARKEQLQLYKPS